MPRWILLLFLLTGVPSVVSAEASHLTLQLSTGHSPVVVGTSVPVTLTAEITSGWHINAHEPTKRFLIPTVVTLTLPERVSATAIQYPAAESQTFAFAPDTPLDVYSGTIRFSTTVTLPSDFREATLPLAAQVRYQACTDTTCSRPSTAEVTHTVPVRQEPAAVLPGTAGASGVAVSGGSLLQLDIESWLTSHGLGVTLLLVMGLGLGLNLTPCVYPMLSVTVAYFGSGGAQRTGQVAVRALAYVLGITTSFSAVGVTAALSGSVFGAALQQPLVLIGLATLMVALALSSFGVYQLQPPSWLMQRMQISTQGVMGALLMGMTMGIVAAPCVGPVVIGLLVFVGSQQDVTLGVQLFFALGFGMGLPYIALALLAGSLQALPRSGEWLIWVERLFGFLLLGMAAYFISPLLPAAVRGWLVPALALSAGIYLGFIERAGSRLPYFRPLRHVAGAAMVLFALSSAWPHTAESSIRWQVLNTAPVAGRPAVLDFVADWCIPCHEMDATTYLDEAVVTEAARFDMFRVDMTHESDTTDQLVADYAVQGVPTIIFLDSTGAEVQRLVGYVGAEELLTAMRAVQ